MHDFIEQLPSIITSLGTLVTAIGIIITAYFSFKAQLFGRQHAIALTKISEDVNGKMSQLLETSGKAEHAKGVLEGKSEAENSEKG